MSLEVDIDPNSGFCGGVTRAIRIAESWLEDKKGSRLYSLGSIVHNEAELGRLEGKGLVTLDPEDLRQMVDAGGETLLIRAHGEPPETYSIAERLGFKVIDCTCPVVLKLQKSIKEAYDRLRSDLTSLSNAIYQDLEKNSATFEGGFYRSIIPGIVAVGVGLLLVVMLLFFLLAFYVNPLYRMLEGLDAYRSQDKKYNVKFDGDDQLARLNEGIAELANENRQFRSRIKTIGKQ